MKPILSVHALKKVFNGTPVLKGIDLDVMPGEVVGLVGANGAGKTTLLSVIAGILTPEDGKIVMDGNPISVKSPQDAIRYRIGIVEQTIRIDPTLTVAQALFRQGANARRSIAELVPAARRLLDRAGLKIDVRTRVGELTRPELGLMETARLLSDDSRLVMLDEVGATFNLYEMDELRAITELLTAGGRGIIYTSHRLSELIEISDRVAVLRDGQIDQVISTDDLSPEILATLMFDESVPTPRRSRGADVEADSAALRTAGLRGGQMTDMNIALRPGSVVSLIGPRNSGIEDLIAALTGTRPAKDGTIMIDDAPAVIASPEDATRLKISYFSETDDGLVSKHTSMARSMMTGGFDENIDFDAEVQAIEDVLRLLEGLENRSADIIGRKSLSLGTRRRMSLVEFMGDSSKLMILHEPTAGIDYEARQKIGQMLNDLTQQGKSALLISSDPDEILNWSDQIVAIADGKVVEVLDPSKATATTLNELCARRQPEDEETTEIKAPTAASAKHAVADPYDQLSWLPQYGT